jgi:archaetidylinositol phosphate synthase
VWIAGRLPRWINSDHLTAIALCAMAAAGASFWAARFNHVWLFAVVASLGLNWFGDSLDGTLARVRQQQRPRYGFYVDHVVDCFGVLFLFAGLALSGFMSPFVAMGLLIAYLMLSIDVYLATYCLTVFRLSFWGVGPTELRLLLAAGALALRNDPRVHVLGESFRLFDVAGVIATASIGVTLLYSVAGNVRALYLAEPLLRPERPCVPAPDSGRSLKRRLLLFYLVGAMGVGIQLGVLWILTGVVGLGYLASTLIAVEVTILHNFLWHDWWTWADRPATPSAVIRRLWRFNLTTGSISIAGNVAVTGALVQLGVHYLAANAVAIVVCSIATFVVSHQLVFVPVACVVGVILAAPAAVHAAELSPAAVVAFDRYVRATEARLDDERAGNTSFLWVDRLTPAAQRDAQARLQHGETVVSRVRTAMDRQFSGAACHHWIATTRLNDAPIQRVVNLMQGYDRYREVYRPAIRRSRTIARDGDRFTVDLQLFMKRIVSVTLNTQSDVVYLPITRTRMQVRSRSTRIAEVRNPGTAAEQEAPVGHDSGFLWRFNNYCALDERTEGTYVQCESLSLSRDIPPGLGWLIGPFVTSVPRDSLEFTLEAMRAALRS